MLVHSKRRNKLKMNFGQLLQTLTPETKKLVRRIEKCNNKISNAKTSLVFNET